jgi:Flp pilus assembly protein TadG
MFRRHKQSLLGMRRRRSGTAAVELAVCLPLMVCIVMGSIEANSVIFLKQRLTWAAYEAARTAITPGMATTNAVSAGNSVLGQYSVSGGSITVTPGVSMNTTPETPVTVTVTAPFSSNAFMPAFIAGNVITTVSATVVMFHQ